MNPALREKQQKLEEVVRPMERVLVAFSGGVDSSFLLASCSRILGSNRVFAVIGDSPTLARRELHKAVAFASSLGLSPRIIHTGEMEDERFRENPEDRCYYCKRDLFGRIRAIAKEVRVDAILDGTNRDDTTGHRPGRRAAEELGILSPLVEAGLGKQDIRDLSKHMGLSTWNQPAMACLASRFPHGHRITKDGLGRIEKAENVLLGMGFRNVRVRDHAGLARIEVDREDIQRLLACQASSILKRLGFRYVTVDLEGFRSGSLSPQSAMVSRDPESRRP